MNNCSGCEYWKRDKDGWGECNRARVDGKKPSFFFIDDDKGHELSSRLVTTEGFGCLAWVELGSSIKRLMEVLAEPVKAPPRTRKKKLNQAEQAYEKIKRAFKTSDLRALYDLGIVTEYSEDHFFDDDSYIYYDHEHSWWETN